MSIQFLDGSFTSSNTSSGASISHLHPCRNSNGFSAKMAEQYSWRGWEEVVNSASKELG